MKVAACHDLTELLEMVLGFLLFKGVGKEGYGVVLFFLLVFHVAVHCLYCFERFRR